jgi:ribosomal-protein-alanine N-acetyltransferase
MEASENAGSPPVTGLPGRTERQLSDGSRCHHSGVSDALYPVNLLGRWVRLREASTRDVDPALSMITDPEFGRYVPVNGVPTLEGELDFLRGVEREAREQPRRQWHLAITWRDGDELLGMVRMKLDDGWHRSADLGYGVRRDHWGRGIATDAAATLITFGFDRLGLHRVWATYHPENLASGAVVRKLGMQEEGRLRDHRLVDGIWRDSIVCAVLETEWRPAHEGSDLD